MSIPCPFGLYSLGSGVLRLSRVDILFHQEHPPALPGGSWRTLWSADTFNLSSVSWITSSSSVFRTTFKGYTRVFCIWAPVSGSILWTSCETLPIKAKRAAAWKRLITVWLPSRVFSHYPKINAELEPHFACPCAGVCCFPRQRQRWNNSWLNPSWQLKRSSSEALHTAAPSFLHPGFSSSSVALLINTIRMARSLSRLQRAALCHCQLLEADM